MNVSSILVIISIAWVVLSIFLSTIALTWAIFVGLWAIFFLQMASFVRGKRIDHWEISEVSEENLRKREMRHTIRNEVNALYLKLQERDCEDQEN